jgi:aspartate aminotransferase
MTGWRLGTIVAPANLSEKMMLMLQTTASCVPPFIQRAGLQALRGSQVEINSMMTTYRSRRDYALGRLQSIPGIACHKPGGAFYLFADIRSFGLSSEEFARRLLDEAFVAAVPGNHFGSKGEGFIRFAYATSLERLELGMDRLEEFCKLRKRGV